MAIKICKEILGDAYKALRGGENFLALRQVKPYQDSLLPLSCSFPPIPFRPY
jgi:hypothetical protein